MPQLVYTVGSEDTDRASVQVAISRLLDLFMRDFVLSWYVPYVGDDLELLRATQLSLELAIQELEARGKKIDYNQMLAEMLEALQLHFAHFNTARLQSGGYGVSGFGASDDALVQHYEAIDGGRHVHPAMHNAGQEHIYLLQVIETVMAALLSRGDHASVILTHVLTRITVKAAAEPTLDMYCDPDFLCEVIIMVLDTPGEADAGAGAAPEGGAATPADSGADTETSAAGRAAQGSGAAAPDDPALPQAHVPAQPRVAFNGANAFDVLPEYSVSVSTFQILAKFNHAEYYLHIRRENTPSSGSDNAPQSWSLYRRFREFLRLHRLLQNKYPEKMRRAKLPSNDSTAFSTNELDPANLEARRVQLDMYLQSLLGDTGLGQSYELCEFLSNHSTLFPNERQADLGGVVQIASKGLDKVTGLAKTVGKFGVSMLTRPFAGFKKPVRAPSTFKFVKRHRGKFSSTNPFHRYLLETATPTVVFPAPRLGSADQMKDANSKAKRDYGLAEIVLALGFDVFSLRETFVWRSACRPVLINVIAGAVDLYLRNELNEMLTYTAWEWNVNALAQIFWPDGVWQWAEVRKSPEQKARTKGEALEKIRRLFPPALRGLMGTERFEQGLCCALACIHFPRLNRNLILCVFEIVLSHLFPNLTTKPRAGQHASSSTSLPPPWDF